MKNILFFVKLPPPITGATLINDIVCRSESLNSRFNIKILPVSYKQNLEDYRIFSLKKFVVILSVYINLIKELFNFKPYIIYFQISPVGTALFRDLIYVFIIRFSKAHMIYHLHGKGIQEYIGKSKLKKKIYKWAFNKSSIICLADSLTYDIKTVFEGVPYILNNAIDIAHYTASLKDETKEIVLLFLSNLLYSKGVFDYLDAIAILKSKGIHKFKAIIAGKEAEITARMLQREIDIKQINDFVTYVGSKFGDEKKELLGNSDIFVFPTHDDAFPLVIIEAMQAGLPIVSTLEGAIPEMIDDGLTGFLVDKYKPEQIAAKLEFLINDAKLRKQMGEASRNKFLEKFTLDIFEKKIMKIFNDVIENIV